MPYYPLNLVGGGNLLLVGGGNLLMAGGTPYEPWRLYDFDPIEETFKSIVTNAIADTGAQVIRSRETPATNTPWVSVILGVNGYTPGGKQVVIPSEQAAQYQADTYWYFSLAVTANTNRTQPNAELHAQIVAKCRYALQLWTLYGSWPTSLAPLHDINDTKEQPVETGVDDEGSVDYTKLTFNGQLFIRTTAWPLVGITIL